MFLVKLVVLILTIWVILALGAFYFSKKTFKKYKNMPRKVLPNKYRHIIRKDIGNWGEKEILKGCFIHFPLSFSALASYILWLGTLVAMQQKLGISEKVVNAFRRYYGRVLSKIYFRLKESYNPWKEIETPLVIANHVSENDHLYIMSCLSTVSFVSKAEMGKIPIIGYIAKHYDSLFVQRESAENRRFIKSEIRRRVDSYMKDSKSVKPIAMYPEGTTSNNTGVLMFNNGAFDSLAPITLLSLNY